MDIVVFAQVEHVDLFYSETFSNFGGNQCRGRKGQQVWLFGDSDETWCMY